jgi:hypothetical protein
MEETPAAIPRCRLQTNIWINLEEKGQKALVWINLAQDGSLVSQFAHRNKIFITVIIKIEIVNIYIITIIQELQLPKF